MFDVNSRTKLVGIWTTNWLEVHAGIGSSGRRRRMPLNYAKFSLALLHQEVILKYEGGESEHLIRKSWHWVEVPRLLPFWRRKKVHLVTLWFRISNSSRRRSLCSSLHSFHWCYSRVTNFIAHFLNALLFFFSSLPFNSFQKSCLQRSLKKLTCLQSTEFLRPWSLCDSYRRFGEVVVENEDI